MMYELESRDPDLEVIVVLGELEEDEEYEEGDVLQVNEALVQLGKLNLICQLIGD